MMEEGIIGPHQTFYTVCGEKITDIESHPSSIYRGKVVHFCSLDCLRSFENDPDAYINSRVKLPEG